MSQTTEFKTPLSSKKQTFFIIMTVIVYAVSYLARYSYSANINLIMSDYGCDHASAGLVTTFFYFSYGFGQIFHGFFCKKYPQKLMIPFALTSSAILNIILFFNLVPFGAIKYLWLINGFILSILWPSVIFITSLYLDEAHLKLSVILYSTTATLGQIFSYGSSAAFVRFGNYRISFLTGFIFPVIGGMVWFLFFKNVKTKKAVIEDKNFEEKKNAKLSKYIFASIFILLIFAFSDNFIKDGIQNWIPAILKESFGIKDDISIILSLILPTVGTIGSFIAVFSSKFIKDMPLLTSIFFGLGSVFFIFIISFNLNPVIFLALNGFIILLMHAANNVITSMSPLIYREYFNSGMIAGILNGACNIGSMFSSFAIGKIADTSGWNSAFQLLFISTFSVFAVGFIFCILNHKKIKG